jgi:hypothetical protein
MPGPPLAGVGPVCESGDFLARDRLLALAEGDLLAVRATGAYGFAMSSNYNSRPRACEVIVDGERTHLARPREDVADLVALESPLRNRSSTGARSSNRAIATKSRCARSVRFRNSVVRGAPDTQTFLAIQENVARIQAAGSKRFVK